MNTIKLHNIQRQYTQNYETQTYANISSILSNKNSVAQDTLRQLNH